MSDAQWKEIYAVQTAAIERLEKERDELTQAAKNYLDRSVCLDRMGDWISATQAREALVDLVEKAMGQQL